MKPKILLLLFILACSTFTQAQLAKGKVKGKGQIVLDRPLYNKVFPATFIWTYDHKREIWYWQEFPGWMQNMEYSFSMPSDDTLRVVFVDRFTLDTLSHLNVYGNGVPWEYTRLIYIGENYDWR